MSIRARMISFGLLASVCVLLMSALSASATPPRSEVVVATGSPTIICTTGPTFDLKATDGYISTPDGNSIYMWSYAKASGSFQVPGPVLCVNEADTVTINLTNELDEPVSIVFPGQVGISTAGGVSGLFTSEAPPAGTVTYSFVASEPGTYLYESGTNPHKQVSMGLYGALIVRPAMGSNYVYNDAATEFNPGREYMLLLHDIDPNLHLAVERGLPYDITARHALYWTVNGRSLPDTVADHFVPWLPNQPYSALVVVEPYDDTTNPLPALVRFLNAGLENHPFHPHGNNVQIIAQDGRLLRGSGGEDTSYEAFTKSIGAGQTYDLFVWWKDADGWATQGTTIPVQIPGLQNLFFHGGESFWSGSPYLGEQGELPVDLTVYNECGEYYMPWHSHALNEFQNFDEGFGGLATLWRIDPPGGCP